ncbi:MAG: DUF1846 domain-containing protein, partial [Kiritimatiellia bacterium]|nr:DUF1846 domain-containing protein [Kiritimatiellia bacterium]
MKRIGFDNEAYLAQQTQAILERAEQFGRKLYLEFGGKLLFDYHAARVLPGYDPNVKVKMLQELRDRADLILCVHAGDIERRKIRGDFGIAYDADAMKLMDDLKDLGLEVCAVVITRYQEQPSARAFIRRLERRGLRVYTHRAVPGYPSAVDTIVSDQGYGANPRIETNRPLVVVTGPGPGSGKMATCLSQIYHDHLHGSMAGYAKFETFPVWNLPLKHPVNLAYEAATADLGDFNQVDPYHLEAHGVVSVNYNRDVEVFPIVERILRRISGECPYRSPTDMGVNRVGFSITDDAVVREAAVQEVIRRGYRARCEQALGLAEKTVVDRIDMLLEQMNASPSDRRVTDSARRAAQEAEQRHLGSEGICCGAAVELADGAVVTGKNSPLLHAASSMVLNAIKQLAGVPDKLHLLAPSIVESIGALKGTVLKERHVSLNLDETLIALSISATSNPAAQLAMERLPDLRGCEVHLT